MDFLTLNQLNLLIADSVKEAFPETYWLMAEVSDVRINHSSGHCYLEFIEKNNHTGSITAKAKGNIWNNTFRMLKPYFEQTTGQAFSSGLKVLVKVSVDFHEVYGFSLTVYDIDPSYTLGDLQLRRQEIIRQLKEDGVLTLNQELELSPVPQKIAIITSPTAAGYEDFLNHLQLNKPGFIFYPKLFPAIMQGEQTENSIIAALDNIYELKDFFDVVVIIRGGGATSDLASFDSYLLAANCAQFPLPIITGIGHERDDTILDLIAYKRAKTPTAVADFLVERLTEANTELNEWQERTVTHANRLLSDAAGKLQNLVSYLPNQVFGLIEKHSSILNLYQIKLQNSTQAILENARFQLKETESFLKLSSPEYILSKGYSITMKDGQFVKSIKNVTKGDKIQTRLADGTIESTVE